MKNAHYSIFYKTQVCNFPVVSSYRRCSLAGSFREECGVCVPLPFGAGLSACVVFALFTLVSCGGRVHVPFVMEQY